MDQLDRLKLKLDGEDTTDALLLDLLESAKSIIQNHRYPCSPSFPAALEDRYLDLQVRIAAELFSRMGAEGQTGHSENGISRSWSSANVSQDLLVEITPKVRVVRR